MINEENLNKLYEGVIAKKELTTQELKSYGFNPSDLTKLVEDKILERIKRGHYEFLDSYSLVKYGSKLIINKEYDKAETCFKKASILSPNYYLPKQQLFFIAIKKSNFPKALEYLEECFYFAERLKDNNFYLFFLNMITELPEKYRTYAKNLKPEEIINLKNKQNEYYKIKMSICHKHFNLARTQLKEKILHNNQETFQDKIIFKLLGLAMNIREEQSQKIKEYLQKAEYEKIVEYLESLRNEYFLNDLDIHRLQLVRELINLRDNNELPKTNKVDTNNLYTAIDNKDYELALLLARKNVEEHKGFFVPQELLMFLTKINEEIARINKTNIEEVKKPEEREKVLLEEPGLEIPTFSTVISYLLNQEIAQATNSIKPYLESIGKEQYEFLVLDLIKLSLINQDITFKEPILLLTSLISNEYTFDISKYVQYFYEKLSTNSFAEARIYLDILTKAGILGEPCTFVANLEIILDQSEKGFSTPKVKQEEIILADKPLGEVEDEIFEEPDIPIELEETEEINNAESITSLEIEEKETTPIFEEKTEQVQGSVLIKTNQTNLEKETEQIRKWLEGQLPKLKKDGIIILEPFEKEKSRIIYEITKELPDVSCFNIGLVDKRMVLRYYTPEKIDNISETFRMAREYFNSQEFTNALIYYRKLLQSLYRTDGRIYSAIGFIYFYLKRKDLAIEYLTVASEMNKVTGYGKDYSEFISQLEYDNEKDRKAYFKMDISEFEEEAILANAPYLEEITETVMNGLPLEDAINKFDLTNEQRDTIILLFARSYFVQGNTLLGNKLLKKYEKSEEKTNVTKDFYQEVINNKNLYKNGVGNDYISYLIRTRHK